MITPTPRRSTEAEFEAFCATCERLAGFDNKLNPFHVDGWLTALACGPVRLPAAQWPALMCGDAFERAFADPPDQAHALATLETRLAVLTRALDAEALLAQPDEARLDPYFDAWSEEEGREIAEGTELTPAQAAQSMTGGYWAEGFLGAVQDLSASGGPWGLPEGDENIDGPMQEMADQVEALLMDPRGEDYAAFLADYHDGKPLERDALLLNACFAVQDLRLFLLDHGPRPETRRVAPQPGRNDPCPCGSGKKFKKCHGVAA